MIFIPFVKKNETRLDEIETTLKEYADIFKRNNLH
jgi:hypothetical protein